MDDFSPGFFMPKRPSFQQASNYVNVSQHNNQTQTPEFNLSRNQLSQPLPNNGRWNNFQYEDRRRPPQVQPPQQQPRYHYYHPSEVQNGNQQTQAYSNQFQQSSFPPLGYVPPMHPQTPKSSRTYSHVQHQQHGRGDGSPPKPLNNATHEYSYNSCEGSSGKINSNVIENNQTSSGDHTINFNYEYPPLTASGLPLKKKKNSPTQVPIQAIRQNDTPTNVPVTTNCSSPSIPWTRASKREPSPSPVTTPIPEPCNVNEQIPEMMSSTRLYEQPQEPVNTDMAIRDIMIAMTAASYKNNEMQEVCNMQIQQQWENQRKYVNAGIKYIEEARRGLSQFQKDFGANDQIDVTQMGLDVGMEMPWNSNAYKWVQDSVYFRELSEASMFEVDERLFVDKRPVINMVGQGQREFGLFDDGLKSGSDVIRSVYDVNALDVFNPKEICARRLNPKSVAFWPIDLVLENVNNFESIKRTILRIKGQTSVSSEQTLYSIFDMNDHTFCDSEFDHEQFDISDVRLQSLARFVNGSWVRDNPMGYVTFMGYNLHKLFKDMDRPGPVCTTFGGPFADRNYSFDASQNEVMKPFDEYMIPNVYDGDCDASSWRRTLRFRRSRLYDLSLDTLFYIFYIFCGDALQLLAAGELYRRGWRFHKTFQVWLTPEYEEQETWQNGMYRYFNFIRWEFVRELFKVNDGLLEGKPLEFLDPLWN